MGVNSLWEIVGPSARPVRLEALTRKRLAVDASIWIYQFLKAVRDSSGNALSQSHIVGFFRRICKLLYFGIQPVFVFDGGAPALKRETIRRRKEKREANQESVQDTAKRLLAINVQRQGQRENRSNSPTKSKRFLPKDEYHLPDLKRIRVDESDDRLMPEEEFNAMTEESFDVVDGIDINTIDPNSEQFANLPMPTQYMILSHLRLKSRLRMGFNKEQLEGIFNDSMDFSKFQIQQVKKRNFYTQKLMDVSGMGEDGNATRRIAGEKDRQYALVRTDNGWSLSLGEDTEQKVKQDRIDDLNDDVIEIENTLNSHIGGIKKKLDTKPVVISDSDSTGSDDDFEDIPLKKPEEEEEDDDFNRAVIQSIYDQHKNDDQSTDSLLQRNQLDIGNDDDLKRAIELSKQDLQSMNEGNEEEKQSKMQIQHEEDQTLEPSKEASDNFLLEESLLFGAPPSNHTESLADNIGHEPTSTNLQRNKEPDVAILKKEGRPIVVEEEEVNTNPEIEEEHFNKSPMEKKLVDSKLKDLEEIEQLIEDEGVEKEDKPIDKESGSKKTKPKNSVPVWFDENIDKNVYYNEFQEPELKKDDKELEDEEAGLIPWDEAKNYFDRQSKFTEQKEEREVAEEVEESEEVEVVEDVEEVVNEVGDKIEKRENPIDKDFSKEIKPDAAAPAQKELVLDYTFVEGEDELAEQQLISEEKDHEKLKRDIASYFPSLSRSTITEEQLLQERLQKQKRDSDEVTQNMINDIKELLRRFGIPFITAPMEAEAQCVELLKLNLVDGIVTDDSDSFLFGGDRIYKNMFNQKQYVECYLQHDLENRLGLDQTKLIELGLLLGSDYTDGIKGIGPVLAMEILAEFGNLANFKAWFDNCITGKADSSSTLKKNLIQRIKNNKLFLSESFPDQIVFEAYRNPEVDHSDEQIKWGVPNLDQIRSFLMYNVGWTQERVDEVMVPLIKDMNRKLREGTQSSINEFFSTSHYQNSKELKLSKRIKAAATKLRKSD